MRTVLALTICLAAPAAADCRLALALGFDVSRSVDATDYAIQRQGILDALADPAVRAAFLVPEAPVALAIYEWSGRDHQELVLDWLPILSEADLDRAAGVVADHLRNPASLPTALGRSLRFAHGLFGDAPPCDRQTLDLSGDGRNNDGFDPADVYQRFDFDGITVNGLAIGGHEGDIADYYRRRVIRGPGAFVEIARTHADFPRAIRRKLEKELAAPVFGALDQ